MQKMSFKTRLSILFLASAFVASAATVTMTGPTLPGDVLNGVPGTPCTPGASGCIIGAPFSYQVFDISFTQVSPGTLTMVMDTNYPLDLTSVETLPSSTIPPAAWEDGLLYSIPDVIIHWNGNNYDIVLATHEAQSTPLGDGYTPGDVYKATNGYTLSGDVLNNPSFPSPRPTVPVWLAPGGSLFGTGTISVAQLGNGTTQASYRITDTFTVTDPNFLSSGVFTVQASSYTCDNGLLTDQGQFNTSGVPEPGTLLMGVPLLLLVGRRLMARG